MAQQQNQMDRKKLCCSICLDLLKDPVTVQCGHSYCMSCIKSCWDKDDCERTNSCPQCRQTFTPRPVLVKNTMLAEDLKNTGLQAAPADPCYAEPGDVACDICTGRKWKAVKSCLQCLVCYCDQHIEPHYESPAFEKQRLVDPSKKHWKNDCSHHGKEIKFFCRTDQQCICYLCSTDIHKDHNIVLASDEWSERQRELVTRRQKIQHRIQDREKDVRVLQQELEAVNHSTETAVKNIDKLFTDLVRRMKNKCSNLKQQIRSQQKTAASRVKEHQKKLQQEITELRRKDAELEQLSHTDDHTQFLRNYPSLSCLSESTESPSINIHLPSNLEDVTATVSAVGDKFHPFFSEEWTTTSLSEMDGLLQTEPKTRAEFLQYSSQITLDPNTANTQLLLSEGNRKATVMSKKQLYSSHPDRFTDMFQVLGKERLSGRHYWEVEKDRCEVSVAVTYKDISRGGYESGFGNDDKSWALECFNNSYEFRHNRSSTFISGPQTSKIGVYLDHSAGILSFYSVSETMTLLHRVQTTFTQPLCQGLGVFGLCNYGLFAELCVLE